MGKVVVKVAVWFVIFIILITLGFEMILAPNIIENVIGFIYHPRNSVENIKPPEVKVECIVNEKRPDFFSKSPQEGLIEALEYYGVKHPQIVYAQAVLETGHFKSNLCLNGNNLFGLYNSKKQKYYTFNHWANSVEAYVRMVQYKYKGEKEDPPNSYYKFLQDIGYAKDVLYISKLKKLVKQL